MFSIRKMKVSDVTAVVDIQNRNLEENSIPLVFLRELYESDLHYVCLYKDSIVGFITCISTVDGIICNTLCVDYPFRRKQIGRHLLNCIKNEGRKISLHVRSNNKGARAFYNKEEFRVVQNNIPYYIDGELGILMEYTNKL